jgi:hypothetical protein
LRNSKRNHHRTWSTHVHLKNPSFIPWALNTKFAAMRGKRGLKLMYVLKPGVHAKADMPITRDFDCVMGEELECAFSRRMEATARTPLRL